MSFEIDFNIAKKIYIGNNLVQKVFMGNQLIYEFKPREEYNLKLDDSGLHWVSSKGEIRYLYEYLKYKSNTDSGEYKVRHIGDTGQAIDVDIELLEFNTDLIQGEFEIGNSVEDGAIVMARFNNSLTIDKDALVTTKMRKKGFFIYVDGDLVVNGTISMTGKGAVATGQDLFLISTNENGGVYKIPAVGGAGGSAVSISVNGSSGGFKAGTKGSDGVDGATGGGGAGGAYITWSGTRTSGRGGHGTSFSGGTGGGSAYGYTGSYSAQAGSDNGGMGGKARYYFSWSTKNTASGGAGNIGGLGQGLDNQDLEECRGRSGTGGLLCIFVKGNIVLGEGSVIEANGITNDVECSVGGGSSGGGSVNIFYGGNFRNLGGVTTACGGESYKYGGAGGKGTARVVMVDSI